MVMSCVKHELKEENETTKEIQRRSSWKKLSLCVCVCIPFATYWCSQQAVLFRDVPVVPNEAF